MDNEKDIRQCEAYIQDLMKHTKNRSWIKSRIKSIQSIKNKLPDQERELCSAFGTLSWIPFDKEPNEIRKYCIACEYNKYQNQ